MAAPAREASDAGDPGRGRRRLGAALLLALALGAFAGTLGNGFVNFDDPDYVTGNPEVQRGLDAESLRWAWTSDHAANWHPLTWMSHLLDVELFGLEPRGHHATSVLLHALTALLLYLFLERCVGRGPALATAALFAVHPLRVESVAWISERKDVLAGALWAGALLAYGSWTRRGGWGRYLLVVLLHGAGLLAKPMGVSLPLVLLLLDRWPLRRDAGLRRRVLEKLPLLALSLASALRTLAVQSAGGAVSGFEPFPPGERVANALVAVWVYLRQLVAPLGLSPFYPHPALVSGGTPAWQAALAGLGLAAVSVAVWRVRATRPWWLVGWLWYLVTLLPVAGLVQVGAQAHADRYTYLPLLGPTLALVLTGAELLRGRELVARGLTALLVAASVAGTVRQVSFWRTSESLWRRAIAVTDRNYFALLNLGVSYDDAGDFARAADAYRRSVELLPANHQARLGLGVALARSGSPEEAERVLRETVALHPDLAPAWDALGRVLSGLGRAAEAEAAHRRSVELDPELLEGWNNLGSLLIDLGRPAEARDALRRAALLAPGSPPVLANLGRALEALGDEAGAAASYRSALAAAPSPAVAALLADLLATARASAVRDGAAALELARLAARGPGARRPEAQGALAAALAETGDLPGAVAAQERAVQLLQAAGADPGAALARLASYEAGKAWRR